MFNLPVEFGNFPDKTLFVGAGGGFDVYGALPLSRGISQFANLSSSGEEFVVRRPTVNDFPEYILSEENIPTWCIGRNGSKLVKQALEEIKKEFDYNTIVTIDGGVDSLMRGDEANKGTYMEDCVVLSAISQIPDCRKIHVCVGFGTETDEELNHYRALENIATLIKNNYFLGSCSLTAQMEEFKIYERICQRAWSIGRKSHIHTKVISAVHGAFGKNMFNNVDAQLHESSGHEFVLPLNSIYWFFDFDGVVAQNIIVPHLNQTNTFSDAMMVVRQLRSQGIVTESRSKEDIPL